MRNIILPVLLFGLIVGITSWVVPKKKKKAPKKFTVTGTIKEVRDYCGGAAPGPEQLNRKPYPVAGIKLYIRKGIENSATETIVDSIVSGADGKFTVELPAGQYCLVEAWKKPPVTVPQNNPNMTWDSACYVSMYKKCDYGLYVNSNKQLVEIVIPRHCAWTQPCGSYNGPLPPSAPPGRSGQPGHQE
jgi:hypothetical protein